MESATCWVLMKKDGNVYAEKFPSRLKARGHRLTLRKPEDYPNIINVEISWIDNILNRNKSVTLVSHILKGLGK